MPSPRNDSSASPITATGMITVACTMIADSALGRMCWARIRPPDASSACREHEVGLP